MRKSSLIFIFALLINLAISTVPDCRDIEPWAMSTCYADGTYVFTDDGQIFQAQAINGKKAVDNCCQDPHTQTNYWQNTGSTCGCPCAGIPVYDENFNGYYNAGTRRVFNGIIWRASTRTSSYPLDANSQWVVDGVCFKSCNAAPSWSNSRVYYENNVVIRNNRLYIATWQTQGVAPNPTALYNGWRHLGRCFQITIETDGCDVDLSCPFERDTDGLFRLLQSEEFDVTFTPNSVDSQGRSSRIKRILVNNFQVNGAFGPGESVTRHFQGLTANTVIRAECETETILTITSDIYTQDGARADGEHLFWPSENTPVSSCAIPTPSGNDRQTRVTGVLVDGESSAYCYTVLMNEDHTVDISGEIEVKLTISSDEYTQDGEQEDGTYYYWPSDGEVYNSCALPTQNEDEVERLRRVTQVLVDSIIDPDFCYILDLDTDHSIVISGQEQYKLNIASNELAQESILGVGCHFYWPGETAQICPEAIDVGGERERRINSFTINGEETPVECPYSIVMNSDVNVNIQAEEQFCLTIQGTGTTESTDGEYVDGTYCLWPGTEVDLCIQVIDVPNRQERIKEVLYDGVQVDLNNICPFTITMNADHIIDTCTESQVKLAITTDQYTEANLVDGCIFKYPSEIYTVEVCASATPNSAEPQRLRRITSFTVNNVPKVGCEEIVLTEDTNVVITGEEQVRLSIQGDCLSNNQALTQNYYFWPNTNTGQFQITAPQEAGKTCSIVSVSGASNPVQFSSLTSDRTVVTDCNCVCINPIFCVPAGQDDNILFIIDNSGSMNENSNRITYQGVSRRRWNWVEIYLRNYIDTLTSSNRVNIITFDRRTPRDEWKNSNPSTMSSSWRMDTSGRNNIKNFIDDLTQNGQTDLQEALDYGINRNYINDVDKIYFLSDGVPTEGSYQTLTSFTNWLTSTFNTPSVSAKINNKLIVVNIGPTSQTRAYMRAIVWLNVVPQTDANRQYGAVYYEFP